MFLWPGKITTKTMILNTYNINDNSDFFLNRQNKFRVKAKKDGTLPGSYIPLDVYSRILTKYEIFQRVIAHIVLHGNKLTK